MDKARALELWRLAYEAGDDLARRALERFDSLPQSSVAKPKSRRETSRAPSLSSARRFDRRSMLKSGGRGGGGRSKFALQQAHDNANAELSGSDHDEGHDNNEGHSDDGEFTLFYGGASASAGGSVGSTLNPIFRGFGVTDQMWGNI